MFRFFEKVRYKWRRRRTLVRFVVLTLDATWNRWAPAEAKCPGLATTIDESTTMQVESEQRSGQAA